MQKIISAFVIAIGLAFSGYFIGYGILNFHQFNRYVAVKGLAEKTVKANEAVLSISFNATGDSLKEIYQNIKQSQNTIVQFLNKNGISQNEISLGSTSINTNDQKDNQKQPKYSAYANISVVTSKVDLVKKLNQETGDLIEKGVLLTSSSANYRYTDLNQIKPQMLIKATESAKKAASTFAKNADAHVGSIRQASQGLFSISNANDNYGNEDIMKKVRVVVQVEYFVG